MSSDAISVAGVVAAYKRPEMLRSLLASLQESRYLRKMIVVDNGLDAEMEAICREQSYPVLYHRPECNLGCGGGVARGLQLALQDPAITHFCCFDDDAHATPGALEALMDGMIAAEADLAVPLIIDADGYIGWQAGLQDRLAWKTILRKRLLPEDYRAICGLKPVPFTWAPWTALALTPRVIRECGYPREDFWFCVEDLEFVLRLTYRHRGVMVPSAVCRHVPPPASGGNEVESGHYLRFCLSLQNLAYVSTRLPHGRRILRHLPGNYLRFFRTFGLKPATVRDVWLAWWLGGMRGQPAGIPGFDSFKQRFLKLAARREQRAVVAQTQPG